MRMMSDAQQATLELIHCLAPTTHDVERAFREGTAWAGVRERRPPTLSEVFGFLIERRREAGEPAARPWPEAQDSWATRLAGDSYGFFGHAPARTRWPFDLMRSPLAPSSDGVILRLYIALALRMTFRFQMPPAFWAPFVACLRILLVAALVLLATVLFRSPLAAGILALAASFWVVLTGSYVGERIRWAASLIEANYALLEAEHRFGNGVAELADEDTTAPASSGA